MHLVWFLALVCAARGAPFPPHEQSPCPSDCECLTVDLVTTTRCTSLAFVQDGSSETLNKVSHLDLRHSNLTKIGAIRKLHGLKSVNMAHNDIRHLVDLSSLSKLSMLNLRGNKLKSLDVNNLPKNLEHLDVSSNHFADFPDFVNGKKLRLRKINLAGNPFICSCELKAKCEDLKTWVTIEKPVTCRDGSGNIQEVTNLKCPIVRHVDHNQHNDLEKMQNDEQIEGSGEEPEPTPEETSEEDQTDVFAEDDEGSSKKLAEMQNEELLLTASSPAPELTDEDYIDNGDEAETDDTEGSGHSGDEPEENEEEGSGTGVLIFPTTEETPLKACNFDCSTPLTLDDPTNSTEPDPSIFDEIKKAVNDIFSDEDEDDEEYSSTSTTETPMTNVVVHKSEQGRSDGVVPIIINEEDKIHSVEDTEASEVKEAGNPLGLSNNMIVVIALIIVMACIIIYTILIKRRKNRRQPRRINTSPGQEMKTIKPTKPTRTSLPPSDKSKSIPEKVPLMNGQNGNQNGNQNGGGPKNGSTPNAPAEVTTPLINEPPQEKEDFPATMRSPRGDHSPLLPETHRVTVQAKELTAPKTPLLINRVRSQDGQIITTPESDQQF